jgi:hypothetical protein
MDVKSLRKIQARDATINALKEEFAGLNKHRRQQAAEIERLKRGLSDEELSLIEVYLKNCDTIKQQAEENGRLKTEKDAVMDTLGKLRLEINREIKGWESVRIGSHMLLHRQILPTLKSFVRDTMADAISRYEQQAEQIERLKEQHDKLVEDMLLIDQYCLTNDIDLEAITRRKAATPQKG